MAMLSKQSCDKSLWESQKIENKVTCKLDFPNLKQKNYIVVG